MCPFFSFLFSATRRVVFSLFGSFFFSLSPDCMCFFLECTNNETFFLRIIVEWFDRRVEATGVDRVHVRTLLPDNR